MPLTDRDKRTMRIGGIVLGVFLVGFLLFNLLSGGGGEEEAGLTPITPGTGGGVPTETESPSLSPSISPVAIFTGRDPFSVPPGLGTTTSAGGTTPPTSGGTTPPTSGTTSTSSTSTTTSSSTPPTDSGTQAGADNVVLLDAFFMNGVGQADVEVNGTVYHVAVGETFANGRYELRSVSDNCATFLRGDESFTLCVTPQK